MTLNRNWLRFDLPTSVYLYANHFRSHDRSRQNLKINQNIISTSDEILFIYCVVIRDLQHDCSAERRWKIWAQNAILLSIKLHSKMFHKVTVRSHLVNCICITIFSKQFCNLFPKKIPWAFLRAINFVVHFADSFVFYKAYEKKRSYCIFCLSTYTSWLAKYFSYYSDVYLHSRVYYMFYTIRHACGSYSECFILKTLKKNGFYVRNCVKKLKRIYLANSTI